MLAPYSQPVPAGCPCHLCHHHPPHGTRWGRSLTGLIHGPRHVHPPAVGDVPALGTSHLLLGGHRRTGLHRVGAEPWHDGATTLVASPVSPCHPSLTASVLATAAGPQSPPGCRLSFSYTSSSTSPRLASASSSSLGTGTSCYHLPVPSSSAQGPQGAHRRCGSTAQGPSQRQPLGGRMRWRGSPALPVMSEKPGRPGSPLPLHLPRSFVWFSYCSETRVGGSGGRRGRAGVTVSPCPSRCSPSRHRCAGCPPGTAAGPGSRPRAPATAGHGAGRGCGPRPGGHGGTWGTWDLGEMWGDIGDMEDRGVVEGMGDVGDMGAHGGRGGIWGCPGHGRRGGDMGVVDGHGGHGGH